MLDSDSITSPKQLIDRFGRIVDYVRISVTDRCDLRCRYCMSEDMQFVPRAKILTLEEITAISRAFVSLGVKKIRFTGGEPLVRRNILKLFDHVGKLDGLREMVLTTNGTQLSRYAEDLKTAGIKRINISLDSLKDERFRDITRVGNLQQVFDGIDKAIEVGFERIKLNTVILKNRNHEEICDLVTFAHDRQIDITFIEEMPLGFVGDHDRKESFYSSNEILDDLQQQFDLTSSTVSSGGPARYYQLAESNTRVGFISPHTHNFCDQCNRVRLTAEGRLLLCLGQEHSVDLRQVVRNHPGDDNFLKQSIIDAMLLKPEGHEFELNNQPVLLRNMNVTGG